MGKTNYQTANKRLVLPCIFPESHDSSTEDRGLWLRDCLATAIQSLQARIMNFIWFISNQVVNKYDITYS